MLQTLELSNFRSYASGLFEFDGGVNIIVGPNASGKTNLLEAINVICTSKSFKASDKDLTTIGKDWFRLEAMTDEGLRVVKYKDNQKISEIDEIVYKRLPSNKQIPVIVFEPEHMLMLSNEPERRRNYIDTFLSITDSNYASNLREYKRALAQRNRLLKEENISYEQLFAWNVQLVSKAETIVKARKEIVDKLSKVCQKHYQTISNSKQKLKVSYSSKLALEDYPNNLMKYLNENMSIDRTRGYTGAGPHRDDLLVVLKGHDARNTASRGETRSIVLAFKIAELEMVESILNIKPILLLDDVFSELDGARRRALAEALKDYQTFITTTDADVAVDHFSNYNIIPMS